MTRSFEKSIDYYILSDKNYVIPKEKVHDYVKSVISIPYREFLDYVLQNRGCVTDEQLTQSSSFVACSSDMCKALESHGNPGLRYVDIGQLFPQYVKVNNDAAFRKYGENQIKTSTQLGLTFEYYGCWYLTCVGYIYNELDDLQQKSLLARTILRTPLYQEIVTVLLYDDVDLTKYMQSLSDSTKGRRIGSILRITNLCLDECRKEGIQFHDLYYPKYNAKTKSLSLEKQAGTLNKEEPLLGLLFSQDTIDNNKDNPSYNVLSNMYLEEPTNHVSYLQDDDEEDLLMAAEDYECYQWNRADESIMNFFGGEKTILVGCYKNKHYLEWIQEKGIYSIRLGKRKGAMEAESPLFNNTSHLVLYDVYRPSEVRVYEIVSCREMTGEQLKEMDYPKPYPGKKYMTFKLRECALDATRLKDHQLIERIILYNPNHVKGTPVFLEP